MYSVLVVDDEAEIRSAISAYYPWSEFGFVVAAQARDADEASSVMQAMKIDLVLSDIRMPGRSGLELAAWIAGRFPGTKVVLLSAYRDFEYAREALGLGVRAYIVKPPVMEEFRDLLGALRKELDEARGKARGEEGTIGTVRKFVAGNLANATLENAARAVGLNPNYLCTLFRDMTGEHFSEFLSRARMERAATLLCDRKASVLAASEEVGYSSPKNFSRAFRQYFGQSPQSWRRNLERGGQEKRG